MTNYTKRAVRGTAVLFFITLIAAFVAYLTRIVLARSLTPAEYGLFFAVFVFVSFFNVVRELGLGYAIINKIPSFLVKKQHNKIKSTIIYTLLIQLTIAVTISIILFSLSGFLARTYFKNSFASVILGFLLIMFILDVFTDLLKKTFQAFQKTHYFAIIELLRNTFTFIIILILLYFNFKLLSPAIAYPVASFLIIAIFTPIFLKIFPFFKHKFTPSKKLVKELFYFGFFSITFLIGYKIISYMDVLILTYYRTLTEVGIYNVVLPTAAFTLFLSRAICNVILPMSSELWTKKQYKKLLEGLRKLHKYVFVLMVPAVFVLISFSKLFLRVFFREEYVIGSLPMQIILIGVLFYALAQINSSILIGIGKPRILIKIFLIAAVLNLILNFILIPKYGMVGAAVATSTSYLLTLIISERSMKKLIDLKFPWKDITKIIISGIIFVLSIYYIKKILILNVWVELIITLAIAGLIYLTLVFLLKILTIKEIKQFIRMVR